MTPEKRMFDLIIAAILLVLLFPVMVAVGALILFSSGAPVFYVSERMRTPSEGFRLIKFRTMKTIPSDSGVSGGDKTDRITPLGAFLRKTRLDELPQLWNVIMGDMSFVGPRPPLRQYVDRFPETYQEVLQARPGITGLASIYFHSHEEKLLAKTRSVAETDAVYARACIPRKARLDRMYMHNRSLCLDCELMLKSVFRKWR